MLDRELFRNLRRRSENSWRRLQAGLLLAAAVLSVFLSAGSSHAAEAVRVMILPFEIHATETMAYLENEIPGIIKTHLEAEGAEFVDPALPSDVDWRPALQGVDALRNFGIKHGADHVIWGSLTWVGQQFSLDAKMIESFAQDPPQSLFVEGSGVENLLAKVKDLARNLALKLFAREKVVEIQVAGNQRIEADAIKRKINTQAGDIYSAKNLSEDLKSVYGMGYFEDIRIEAETGTEGKRIVFKVKEKPTIRVIRILGNRVLKDDKIRENLNIKTGSILNIYKINSNIKRIETLYRDKNYHNVKVSYKVHDLDNNQGDLEFIIEEGDKVRIKTIEFIGNETYPDDDLKELMKTSEKGIFFWLTGSGDLDREDLNQDTSKIAAFYHNNGYIQARVGDAQVVFEDQWIYVTIKIDEGPRYRRGKVDIEGDLIFAKSELQEKLKISGEEYYNREVMRKDVLTLTDLYSDEGYAYADIAPRIDKDDQQRVVDITYTVSKGKPVYFEKIIIGGNTKTRDKVIRRELKVYEEELYSGVRLKRGVRNLYRLDYFEDVKVNTAKGQADDRMILKIDVTEKATGNFAVGGGYSSIENLFAMASVTQRNLFGRGQTLSLKAEIGGSSTRYTLSFTEPWLFDIPLSAGIDLYDWVYDYDNYDKDSTGMRVRFGYPVYDYTRLYMYYNFDISDISDIDEEEASYTIIELEGENTLSSVTTKLRYDSRDRIFNPTEGSDHSLSVEYAGGPFGGDMAFTKYMAETGWYVPLFWSTVGFLHARAGFAQENAGGLLPDYEKFYLGGINSIRGFGSRDIHVLDDEGKEIGGDKFVQFNVEYIIPLFKEAGIMLVTFFDTGNVYGEEDDIDVSDMRESAGFGFRWYSPIGPMRIEYGHILDQKEDEDRDGRWEFTMGQAF